MQPIDNKSAEQLDLRVEKLVYGGAGLSRLEGRVVLTPFVLPGEEVSVQPARQRSGMLESSLLGIDIPSPERVEAPCPVFTRCGGCHYQHAGYEYQLAQKVAITREVLQRIGKIQPPEEIGVVSGEPWNYRNRTQFHFDDGEIGFLAAGSHTLVPIDHCPISSPRLNENIRIVRKMMRDRRWPSFLQSLEMFTNEKDTLVNVLETEGNRRVEKRFFEWMAEEIPGAMAGWLDYQTATGTFRVSGGSFFQVNRNLIDKLVDMGLEYAAGGNALELYAGVGLFSIPLARRVNTVTAVESNGPSTRDLLHHASQAGVSVNVYHGTSEQYLETLATPPDFVLADPPRSGLGKPTTKHLLRLLPARISVISCDPSTLARDLAALTGAGYRILRMAVVDLFPQTFHIETVTHLERS